MMKCAVGLVLFLCSVFLFGCGDSSHRYVGFNDRLSNSEFRNNFADRAVALWLGMDFTYGGDGTDGIDGAGTVIETLQDLGYAVPEATADGLHGNYSGDPAGIFYYTEASDATGADIQAGDYSGLEKGDLIFLDYDFDEVYDHVCIFLGSHGAVAVAALTASDYYDEVVIADLENYNDPLAQDIEWSNVAVRRLDHGSIDEVYAAP